MSFCECMWVSVGVCEGGMGESDEARTGIRGPGAMET